MSVWVVLLAGLLQALSLAWPFEWGWEPGQSVGLLQLLAMGLLFANLSASPSPRHGAWLGWCYGLSSLAGTFWWLYISMHTYGGLPSLLAAAGVLALAGGLAWVYAVAAALWVAFKPALAWRRALLFASLWTLAELERGTWLTGFPWGAGGYAYIDSWLAPYLPWVGVYGVGALAAWFAASTVAWRQSGWVQRAVCLLLAGLPLSSVMGLHPVPGAPLEVSLLQGNIPQDQKFQRGTGIADSLRWYGAALRAAQTSLVVAPETALPQVPQDLPTGYWDDLRQIWQAAGAPARAALFGIPLGDERQGYTNSVLGFRAGGEPDYRYDKQHLVPFGEFIPPMFHWFTRMMHIPLGDFNRGAVVQAPFLWRGERLAPNICYEDLFGEELAQRFADPATAPTILVNVSNLAWFDDSVAIDQHLNIARTRSREFARPSLRATNTGATVIIDHWGQVRQSLPHLTRAVLVGQVQGVGQGPERDWDRTPYARWCAFGGLWPLGGLALGLAVWLMRSSIRTRARTA